MDGNSIYFPAMRTIRLAGRLPAFINLEIVVAVPDEFRLELQFLLELLNFGVPIPNGLVLFQQVAGQFLYLAL